MKTEPNTAESGIPSWLHQLGRRLTRRLWLPEIEAAEADALIKELHATEDGMELHIKQNPHKAQWVAQCFAEMVAKSPNYTEVRFDTMSKKTEGWQWLTVTVQKGRGKTPHQMRQEAEQERDRYKAMLDAEPTRRAEPRHGNQ